MSRSERRRGGRNKARRENIEKNERGERVRSESRSAERTERENRSERGGRSGKRHESRGRGSYARRQERRKAASSVVNQKEIEETRNAIRAFRENVVICEICGEQIVDIENAISNKNSGKPVHFDCVLSKIAESEKVTSTERVAYIGQGKFAVLYFENPHDQKHFTIRRTIEWETRDQERGEWRNEMAGIFSQVK